MPRPHPDLNASNLTDLVEYVNTVTNEWMTTLTLIACVIILFVLMKTKLYKTSDSLMVSGFLTMILGSFFWAAGLIAGKIIIIILLITVGAATWSVLEQD